MKSIIISGIAGGTAGVCVDLIYFPIDTIKTRIQASTKQLNYSLQAHNVSKYRGVLLSSILASFPSAFIFFFTYDFGKTQFEKLGVADSYQPILAAAIGETFTNLCRNPFEVVKNQMQVGLDPSIHQTIRSIWGLQGIRGFYAGFTSILMREIPFSSIQFPIYERLKARSLIKKRELDIVDSIVNGGLAGGVAAFCTTPCDVVKSKLMTQRGVFYSSLTDCVSRVNVQIYNQIYMEEGFLGFFKACHYRTLQIGTSGILFFGTYEKVKSYLTNYSYTS